MTERSYWTVAEYAARLQCTPQHVYRLINSGKLRAGRKIGGRTLIHVETALEEEEEAAQAQAERVKARAEMEAS